MEGPERKMSAVFFIAAIVAVIATVMVITNRSAVHALLYLVVSLLAVAIIFYVLGAPFAAALEVIVYAGAIVVLFVFVVMMLNLGEAATRQEQQWLRPWIWVGPAGLSAVLLGELVYMLWQGTAPCNGRYHRQSSPGGCSASSAPTYLRSNSRPCCCSRAWSAHITSGGRRAVRMKKRGGPADERRSHGIRAVAGDDPFRARD